MQDEYHFLNRCTKYISERQALDLKLNDLSPCARNLDDTFRLLYLLCAVTDVAKYLATNITLYNVVCMNESVVCIMIYSND